MLKIYDDKYIIEIKSDEPAEEAGWMKAVLLDALEQLMILDEHTPEMPWFGLHNVVKLIKEMEVDSEQIDVKPLTQDGGNEDVAVLKERLENVKAHVKERKELLDLQQETINSLTKEVQRLRVEHKQMDDANKIPVC